MQHPLIDFFGEGDAAAEEVEQRPAARVRFVGLTPKDVAGLLELRAAILAEEPALDATAARWRRLSRSVWRTYEERTRREGEAAPTLYAWDEPEFEDDEETAAQAPPKQETKPMKKPTPENLTPRQRACVEAWHALAKEQGGRPSPTEVARRAGITSSQPSAAAINALKAARDRGIELPYYDQAAKTGRPEGGHAAKKPKPAAATVTATAKRSANTDALLEDLRARLLVVDGVRAAIVGAIEAVEAIPS